MDMSVVDGRIQGMNVCLLSCSAVFYIILAAMCIFVIYKCLSWDFDQQQDLGKQRQVISMGSS